MKDANPPQVKAQGKAPAPPSLLTTYSIRLAEPEKALVERALKAKGWTPTHFIRQATLEKAAHVANTSSLVKFPFDRLARRLAKQLCEPEIKVAHPQDLDDKTDLEVILRQLGAAELEGVTEPPPFRTDDVEELRQAVRYGGLEFVARLLDECDRLLVDQRVGLPPPIDPSTLG